MTNEEIAGFFNTTRPHIRGNPDCVIHRSRGGFARVSISGTAPSTLSMRKERPPMIQDLEQIDYRQGMLKKGMKPEDLPVKVWRGAKIPADARAVINAENLLNLGGVYGDKKAGDPMEYVNLKLGLTDDTVEITVFNRGMALFMSDDDRVHRIHRALCKLDGLGKD